MNPIDEFGGTGMPELFLQLSKTRKMYQLHSEVAQTGSSSRSFLVHAMLRHTILLGLH